MAMEMLKRISGRLSMRKEEAPIPVVSHSSFRKILRGEDFFVERKDIPWPGSTPEEQAAKPEEARMLPPLPPGGRSVPSTYSLFAVFDGHNGPAVAKLASEKIGALIHERLPWGPVPDPLLPAAGPWRAAIQRALVESLIEVDYLFALLGTSAGATATVALVVDWVVTVASVGDSRASVDTGSSAASLTIDDRLATNQNERRRVEAQGARVAPIDVSGRGPAKEAGQGVGPLRVWPGGLCLSRALGDFDVGRAVIAYPHVRQVALPPTGARLLIASDGLWDAFNSVAKVAAISRMWNAQAAPQRLVDAVVSAFGDVKDDTTVVVADILPPDTAFPDVVARLGKPKGMNNRLSGDDPSSCGCFGGGGSATKPPKPQNGAAGDGKPKPVRSKILADVDVAELLLLTPDPQPPQTVWFSKEVGQSLLNVAGEAASTWRRVAVAKYRGRSYSTPDHSTHWNKSGRTSGYAQTVGDLSGHEAQLALEVAARKKAEEEGSGRAAAAATAAAAAAAAAGGEQGAPSHAAPHPAEEEGTVSLRRNPSQYFADSVADDDEEYAELFGKYKRESLKPQPGEAVGTRPLSEATAPPGGVGGSVRAGPLPAVSDYSVRMGGAPAFADYSVRAGTLGLPDGTASTGVSSHSGIDGGALPIPEPLPDDSEEDEGAVQEMASRPAAIAEDEEKPDSGVRGGSAAAAALLAASRAEQSASPAGSPPAAAALGALTSTSPKRVGFASDLPDDSTKSHNGGGLANIPESDE